MSSSSRKNKVKKEEGRKFTILEKALHNHAALETHPIDEKSTYKELASIGIDPHEIEEEDYLDDFESGNSPENNPLFFVGKSIDDLIHPLEEFTNPVHEVTMLEDADYIYDETFHNDNISVPTSPIQYKEGPSVKDVSGTGTEEENDFDGNIHQMSSVTFEGDDNEFQNGNSKSKKQKHEASPRRASPLQSVKRVFTAPKHRMIITPSSSKNGSVISSGRSQSQNFNGNSYSIMENGTGSEKQNKQALMSNSNVSARIPRPPNPSERSSKVSKTGMKFERISIIADHDRSSVSIKNAQSNPNVGTASKSNASSNYNGSKATLPTKEGSTVVTGNWGAGSEKSSIYKSKWHDTEIQRQLQVANKRLEDYRRANEILLEKLDTGNVQVTIDHLKYELACKDTKLKELQKENQDLKFLSRYQQKELKDQDFGIKEEFDAKMSQEKYIEVLSVHISKLRKKMQEYRVSEERHIIDWEESQETIKKLRGKVSKLKKTVQQQKYEISLLRTAQFEDNSICGKDSEVNRQHLEDDYNDAQQTVVTNQHDEGSLAGQVADYVSSKVEKRYLKKIQILKKDLEAAQLEAAESVASQKKIEQELDRRELLVKRQNHELRDLKLKFEELSVNYKQLLHGCELFSGDSTKREIKKSIKAATPKEPVTPVVEVVESMPDLPSIEPQNLVVPKAAILADDDYVVDFGWEISPQQSEAAFEPPSSFFLTGDEVSADSIVV